MVVDLSPESLKALSPRQKAKIIERVLLSIVRERGDRGVTVSEIEELTGLNRKIVKFHLDKLVAMRELYSAKMGNTTVYFPNGRVERVFGSHEIRITKDLRYVLKVLRNAGGYLDLFIQEQRREDPRTDLFRAQGGLIVPLDSVPEFLTEIHRFYEKILEVKRSDR